MRFAPRPTHGIVAPRALVVTDELACFRGVADAGCDHHPITTGKSRHGAGHPAFRWLNTVLANIKTAIVDTYTAVRRKHLVRTLAEYEWRFIHRENLVAMILLLAVASARTKPASYSTFKWADYGAQAGEILQGTAPRRSRPCNLRGDPGPSVYCPTRGPIAVGVLSTFVSPTPTKNTDTTVQNANSLPFPCRRANILRH